MGGDLNFTAGGSECGHCPLPWLTAMPLRPAASSGWERSQRPWAALLGLGPARCLAH